MRLNFSHIILSAALLCAITTTGCRDKGTGSVVTTDKKPVEDKEAPYIEGNKKILHWEEEEMALFIKRYQWEMQRTGTGLYIQILEPGTGDPFQEGDDVTLKYKTFLLSGEMVYDSDKEGLKTFKVARSEEIEALHEAALLLRPGARARLVIPSHLAYGVSGDGNRINGRLPIAMTVEVGR